MQRAVLTAKDIAGCKLVVACYPASMNPIMLVRATCLIAAAGLLPGVAIAAQDWRTQSGGQQTFSAALYTDDHARLAIECRSPAFLSPEIDISFVPPDPANRPADGELTLRVGDKSLPMPTVRFRGPGSEVVFRSVAAGSEIIAKLRALTDDLMPDQPLEVVYPSGSVKFTAGVSTYSAAKDTIERCLPNVIRARRQSSGLSNVQTLLTLEADANDKCRGGGVDDVPAACAERTEYVERLHALGMCYGKRGEAGYQMQWHRCGPTSNK